MMHGCPFCSYAHDDADSIRGHVTRSTDDDHKGINGWDLPDGVELRTDDGLEPDRTADPEPEPDQTADHGRRPPSFPTKSGPCPDPDCTATDWYDATQFAAATRELSPSEAAELQRHDRVCTCGEVYDP